jgi:hypothetical protein
VGRFLVCIEASVPAYSLSELAGREINSFALPMSDVNARVTSHIPS